MRAPDGPWARDDSAAAAFENATRSCRGINTFSAEVGVAGRSGGTRLRGRLVAGFERPGRARLEGVAPFGAPLFILAARDNRAVLLLPRERRVLTGESTEDVLEALTGLKRSADDLLALMGGCVIGTPQPAGGSRNLSGWLSVEVRPGLSVFLRREGAEWRLTRAIQRESGAAASSWMVEYGEFLSGFPALIRLREQSAAPAVPSGDTELTLRVSQRDVNVTIPDQAFDLTVPPGYVPMTLDELRGRGPLADTTATPRR